MTFNLLTSSNWVTLSLTSFWYDRSIEASVYLPDSACFSRIFCKNFHCALFASITAPISRFKFVVFGDYTLFGIAPHEAMPPEQTSLASLEVAAHAMELGRIA